jgi:hypothetical protein
MAASATTARARVRALNDLLRRYRIGGQVVITSGIQALSVSLIAQVNEAVAHFDKFDRDNDPHEEHDFGAVRVAGHVVLFKIDCYDLALTMQSPDPADPAVTRRVMTLMLAEEY